MDTTHPGQTSTSTSKPVEARTVMPLLGLLLRVAAFMAVVGVAYVAGRHLIPSPAVDAALLWVFGALQLPTDLVLMMS